MYALAPVGLAAAAILAIVTSAVAGGETITVTTAADVVDVDWEVATIDDLPGPDGVVSFSEALIASNHTEGHQTIGFAIPPDEWILQFLFPGCAVLTSSTGYFFNSSETVTIDGTTQTAFSGDTNPDGWEVVIYQHGVSLNGDNSTLIGFDGTSVGLTGANGLIEGNTGTMNVTLFGGGGSTIRGNSGGTIKIDRSSDNVVVGNTVDRVRVLGGGPSATNNRVGGPDLADRNFIVGYGYVNSEGLPAGILVQLFDTVGTIIENNWIGTTPDGLSQQGNLASTIGVGFEGENHGTTIRNNRIAGILGHGQGPHHAGQLFGWAILVRGSGSGIDVVGNTIGLDANDDPVLGSVWGIDVGNAGASSVTGIRIGGAGAGEGNTIAGSRLNGVTIGHEAQATRLSGNAIYANDWLGIDLIPSGYGYGVTANDPLDADTGGSGLQNFPVIASATREGAAVRVAGTLHSAPAREYTIELFASPECDESGFGEGQVFLGATSVLTNAGGDAAFDVLRPGAVADGWVVTATATLEPEGATSEFSACVLVEDGKALVGDVDGDGFVGLPDLLLLLAAWGPCPGCAADLNGDGTVGIADLLLLLAGWSPG